MSDCYRCGQPLGNGSKLVEGIDLCLACYLRHAELQGEQAQRKGLNKSQNPYSDESNKYLAFAWNYGFSFSENALKIKNDI